VLFLERVIGGGSGDQRASDMARGGQPVLSTHSPLPPSTSLSLYQRALLLQSTLSFLHYYTNMGWFGGGSIEEAPASTSFDDDASIGFGDSAGMSSSGNDMQDFGMELQQQLIVQQVITKLTDESFQKCITGKPSDSLSGSQVACIHSTVNKWMDTNEFMMGRLAKKQQQQQGGGY